MVDSALHDEDPVGFEELPRGGIRRVEDDDLGTPGRVVERDEHHRLATLRRHLLDLRHDAADGDELAVAPALQICERAVRLSPQVAADAFERVLGDVQAENLLLEPQELALVELRGRERRVLDLDRLVLAERAVEDRRLAREPVGGRALAVAERGLERGEHPEPGRSGRVERAALHERVERALVQDLWVDTLGELPDRGERPTLGTDAHDRVGRRLAHVLHRVETEMDDATDDGEVLL